MPEIVKSNPVNDPTQKPVKNHSKFTPNYSLYATHLFGLNTPHFVMEGVADDDISMRCGADVDTYTLKAPLMQPIRRNMDYFQMTLRSLLPKGAELLITNPLVGDDVSAPAVNAVMHPNQVRSLVSAALPVSPIAYSDVDGFLRAFNRFVHSYQMHLLVTSKASILKNLGYSLGDLVEIAAYFQNPGSGGLLQSKISIDRVYEYVWRYFEGRILNNPASYISVDVYTPRVSTSTGASGLSFTPTTKTTLKIRPSRWFEVNEVYSDDISVQDFLNMLITESYLYRATEAYDLDLESATDLVKGGLEYSTGLTCVNVIEVVVAPNHSVNFLRPLAYQKACAEFYTNDKIDGIYSAKLWEDNQLALARYLAANNSLERSYLVNGVSVDYDSCAGWFLNNAVNCLDMTYTGSPTGLDLVAYAYFHNLFGYTRSLKYEDYFVGAKASPLAVGDVTVGVDTGSSTVDIIDVTKKIQVQRFLNQVNRVGRKFSDYVKGILGDKPMKDVHEPIFLGHVVDTFGAEETDNTGAAQLDLANSTTSKLRNNSQRFGFDVHIGEPSVVIGITSYDIVRVYSSVTDRPNFHVDRYDMFNPFMQFIGDQEVYADEAVLGESGNFAYQMRYMEYKQRVDIASGGFADGFLPGYAKIVDATVFGKEFEPISSDFIRSRLGEIDEFYQVLTGKTPVARFNFIIRYDNEVTARRPMAFAPTIL